MAKIATYTFVIVGIMVLMALAGLPTFTGHIFTQLGLTSPSGITNFQNTSFYVSMWAIIILAIGGSIAIGFFSGQTASIAISALMSGLLAVFIGDWISLINIAYVQAEWMGWLVFVIFAPIVAVYLISLWEWIRGGT